MVGGTPVYDSENAIFARQKKMEHKVSNTISSTVLLLIAILLPQSPQAASADAGGFSYKEGSPDGPKHWGMLRPAWAACSLGHMQSPIALSHGAAKVSHGLGNIRATYKPSKATLVNIGHDIMIKWADGAGGIRVDGTMYSFKQCHWHWPSEHRIDGERFSLEMHMVHQSAENKKTAVIGIPYKYGRPDAFLSQVGGYVRALGKKENATEVVGTINPRDIKRGMNKGYYRYIGSLTTPPCTEGVSWIVMHEVRTVSRRQVEMLKAEVTDGLTPDLYNQQMAG